MEAQAGRWRRERLPGLLIAAAMECAFRRRVGSAHREKVSVLRLYVATNCGRSRASEATDIIIQAHLCAYIDAVVRWGS